MHQGLKHSSIHNSDYLVVFGNGLVTSQLGWLYLQLPHRPKPWRRISHDNPTFRLSIQSVLSRPSLIHSLIGSQGRSHRLRSSHTIRSFCLQASHCRSFYSFISQRFAPFFPVCNSCPTDYRPVTELDSLRRYRTPAMLFHQAQLSAQLPQQSGYPQQHRGYQQLLPPPVLNNPQPWFNTNIAAPPTSHPAIYPSSTNGRVG